MATHSSVLAWRIPGMGEPVGLPSMGSHRVRHDWSDFTYIVRKYNRGKRSTKTNPKQLRKWRYEHIYTTQSVSLVTQSCPTLCNPMTAACQASLSITNSWSQPSLPQSSPSPPAFNLSQYQGLFQWICSSHQVAEVLEFQLQHPSFQWTSRTDFLQDWLVGSPCSPKNYQESSSTPHFKNMNSSVLSFLYNPTLTSQHDYWKNHSLD